MLVDKIAKSGYFGVRNHQGESKLRIAFLGEEEAKTEPVDTIGDKINLVGS